MKLKLGLIGLPSDWQRRYLPALRVLNERFEVAGVYSSVSMLAQNVARQLDAVAYCGFREMLSQADIDAVLMLGSDWYGTAPLHAACDYGKAVYCGSEIDFEPSQAIRLGEAVDQAGIAFMAEFPRRYAPASLRLKELIATRLGQPEMLFCHRRLNQPGEGERSQRTKAGRLTRELMELIDWCTFIVGRRPIYVQSIAHPAAHPRTDDGNDYQMLSLTFPGCDADAPHIVAQVSCGSYIRDSWQEAVAYRPPASVQVCCQNGLAFVDLPSGITWFDDAGRHQESLDSEVGVGQQLLAQFHRAVTSLLRKMGDLEDVTHSLRVLEAAKASIAQQRSVDMRE